MKMRNLITSTLIAGLLVVSGFGPSAAAQQQARRVSYIAYDEARPILQLLSEVLPAELRDIESSGPASRWAQWVARRDGEIRARLIQGDEDSVINFLLFGTSFTQRPRIMLEALARVDPQAIQGAPGVFSPPPDIAAFIKTLRGRADDLIQAMAVPTNNERLLFGRRLIESKGYEVKTAQGRERVRQYLLASLTRVLNEAAGYAKILESARLLGDPSAEFAERSKLYSNRGLSSDTSVLPNFAIEKAIISLKAQNLLAPGSVRRAAIIGPGLDFTDKQDGYDFYPQQTLQPFALIDTLLSMGLARARDLKVTTFDLSPRINDHLARARARALRGVNYVVQLPRDKASRWTPEAIEYWSRFGSHIGPPARPVAAPAALSNLEVRAIKIRPDIVSIITPEDVNVVLQRLNVKEGEGYDLIIATNILVYYDVFEQSLALANIQRMLRPGGLLLSNNALLELPGSQMRSVGYESVAYSDRPDDGDHIVWYQRMVSR